MVMDTATGKKRLIAKTNLLRRRGWTEKTLAMFYPEPYDMEENPLKPTAPIRKYELSKVEQIEATQAFIEMVKSRGRRTEPKVEPPKREKKDNPAYQRKCAADGELAIGHVKTAKITVKKLDHDSLLRKAWEDCVNSRIAAGMPPVSSVFLKDFDYDQVVMSKNILSGCFLYALSNYNEIVSEIRKYRNIKPAIALLKERIMEKVREVYGPINEPNFFDCNFGVSMALYVKKRIARLGTEL